MIIHSRLFDFYSVSNACSWMLHHSRWRRNGAYDDFFYHFDFTLHHVEGTQTLSLKLCHVQASSQSQGREADKRFKFTTSGRCVLIVPSILDVIVCIWRFNACPHARQGSCRCVGISRGRYGAPGWCTSTLAATDSLLIPAHQFHYFQYPPLVDNEEVLYKLLKVRPEFDDSLIRIMTSTYWKRNCCMSRRITLSRGFTSS